MWVVTAHLFGAYGVTSFITGKASYGVFLFFVLSGFILGYVHDRDFSQAIGLSTTVRFWGLRLAKIYPLHAVITLLWVLVMVPLHIWSTLPRDNGFSLALNLLLVHAWGFLPEYTWNMPSWSISIEWFCYLLFPLLPLVLSGRSLIFLLGIAIGLQVAIYTAAALWVVGFLSGTGPNFPATGGKQAAYYFQMFLLGYTFLLLKKRVPVNSVSPLLWDALALIVVLAVYVASSRDDFSQWIPLASSALIFCLAQQGPISQFLLGNAVMRYLGDISYSIYMCHIMAYAILMWTSYELFGAGPPIWIAFLVALSFSAAAYHLVEQPARRAIRRRIAHQQSTLTRTQIAEPSPVH